MKRINERISADFIFKDEESLGEGKREKDYIHEFSHHKQENSPQCASPGRDDSIINSIEDYTNVNINVNNNNLKNSQKIMPMQLSPIKQYSQ